MSLCLRLLVSALLINFDNLDVGLKDRMTRNIMSIKEEFCTNGWMADLGLSMSDGSSKGFWTLVIQSCLCHSQYRRTYLLVLTQQVLLWNVVRYLQLSVFLHHPITLDNQ